MSEDQTSENSNRTDDQKVENDKREKRPQDELLQSAHKIWLAGLGALSVAEEEGTKFFKRLVEQGEGFESRSKEKIEEMREKAEEQFSKVGESVDDQIGRALKRFGVPTREEILTLTERVEELTKKVDDLKS